MNRKEFLSITSTFTGGLLLYPNFLSAINLQKNSTQQAQTVVFIQLNGGNDGLNTYIPYQNPRYYDYRPNIAIPKNKILGKSQGMGFHPALSAFAQIQQNGHLAVIQNVGYPSPSRSHFRSQEIWQTASDSDKYLSNGWLGKYLDLQCKNHQPTAGVNIDKTDNLALQGENPNSITIKRAKNFKQLPSLASNKLFENPQLDFVRQIEQSVEGGTQQIQKALSRATKEQNYGSSQLAKNLSWMARLIKGQLNSKVFYTSLSGFDTHNKQLSIHNRRLEELNDAVGGFYNELRKARLLKQVTIVIFSEFGRRVKDNGEGTDHGAAGPMFVIGKNSGNVIGANPNLEDLVKGDLKHQIDFRSVYAAILQEKLKFNHRKIGITQKPLTGLF